MRPKKPTMRLDGSLWASFVDKILARLRLPATGTVLDDGAQHYDTHGDKDVTLRVETHPRGDVVRCRLALSFAGPGFGQWTVPPVGAEVAVIFPDGELDAGGIIVGVLSTGSIPSGVSDASVTLVVPPGGKIYIRDADGTTEPLVRLSEFLAHIHGTGTGNSTEPIDQAITGTTSLEAE